MASAPLEGGPPARGITLSTTTDISSRFVLEPTDARKTVGPRRYGGIHVICIPTGQATASKPCSGRA